MFCNRSICCVGVEKMKVGFIGLGAMGFPMAQNILKGGFPLVVYNRTKEKAAPLLDQGAQFAATPEELAAQCGLIVSMVADDAALKEIVEGPSGILRAQQKPQIHISMSSVSPNTTSTLAKRHEGKKLLSLQHLLVDALSGPRRGLFGSF